MLRRLDDQDSQWPRCHWPVAAPHRGRRHYHVSHDVSIAGFTRSRKIFEAPSPLSAMADRGVAYLSSIATVDPEITQRLDLWGVAHDEHLICADHVDGSAQHGNIRDSLSLIERCTALIAHKGRPLNS